MEFRNITEQDSNHNDLEKMDTAGLLHAINSEDQKVALAVQKVIPQIEDFVNAVVEKMSAGGRLFYIGAGTSGRLGILDASECPPTFGVAPDKVIGIIAGGDRAIRNAVENAEDDREQAFKDLKEFGITSQDTVIGIAASGRTPFVIGGLEACNTANILTGGICCNPGSPLDQIATYSMVPTVGPEFVTGSSRMKAGTAQKMILNMISTSVMIKLGHIKGNKMVDMQLSNDKLVDRGTRMIMETTKLDYERAQELLNKYGSVRNVLDHIGMC
ncbi:N-acetylmuramic acid 6-phosphate etherase [Nonlabens marinus]|uniref:N-acetylmuramic acid 6-phosphate etherase n=1 Tax=Nonlabens marinus S1-08 TaxID=1454201 RepID=W8VS85_9FLAO|nr:N-acetylmuramic acid 6-phosphate etherase [Nonlabens marinus]BAO56714.1 N-acetylmuramic acid 6-phosphate etherase [Nonlabens marinus S1-08]